MNIHFTLRKQGKNDPVIELRVFDSRFPHRKFSYSTGYSISPADWKKNKGVKSGNGFPREKAELFGLIKHLRLLENSVLDWGKDRYNSKTLNREDLRKHLEASKRDERKEKEEKVQKEVGVFTLWQEIIDTAKSPKTGLPITNNAIKDKAQTRNRVSLYCVDTGFTPTLLTMDLNFYHSFDEYMRRDGLCGNSRGKHFKQIKAFLREAAERGHKVSQDYQKKAFRVIKEDVEDCYLTLDEIAKLEDLRIGAGDRDITGRQAELRDIFVAACFVGVRYSDWHQINPKNVVIENGKSFLKVKQQKTNEIVHVPVHATVRQFLEKYKESGVPKIISNQKFNKAIQQLCKKALVDEKGKPFVTKLNGKEIEKWTSVSSHTVRRSMATNLYLTGDLDILTIRQLTGHRSEASFMKYLKLNGKDLARKAADSKFFAQDTWRELKVA